jgi:hypothetical protein
MIHVLARQLDAGLESLIRLRFVLLDALLERQQDFKVPLKIRQGRAFKFSF